MSEQHRPEAVWVFPPKKSRGPKTALIVLLVVLVLAVIAGVAVFLIPHGDFPPLTTRTPAPSPSATMTVAPSETVTPAPSTTAPTPGDPSVAVFREQIGYRLTTASQGLDLIAQGGSDAPGALAKLQGDAQRLADAPPPLSIESDWRSALQAYSAQLNDLERDPADAGALSGARAALRAMQHLIGD